MEMSHFILVLNKINETQKPLWVLFLFSGHGYLLYFYFDSNCHKFSIKCWTSLKFVETYLVENIPSFISVSFLEVCVSVLFSGRF